MFSQILVEFLFRLTFGVAAAMGLTSAKLVTSGFFRVHLWVLLGVQTLAALALYSVRPTAGAGHGVSSGQFWLAVAAATFSYVGAVIWMYERTTAGKIAIGLVAGCALVGCWLPALAGTEGPIAFHLADKATGGMVLGLVTTAMLLGHWYLNTPTMKLEPLKRLIMLLVAAVAVRAVVSGSGAVLEAGRMMAQAHGPTTSWYLFVALRWLTGLVSVAVLGGLTWQTLKIPNTQSATGILYAGVIVAFIGELTSQLLSAEAVYPV